MPYDRNSKPDTRLLIGTNLGGAGTLHLDQSQWEGNLTHNTTYLTSTNAALGVRSPREIAIVVPLDNNDTGYLVNFGNLAGTSFIYRIEVSGASGLIRFHHNSANNLATLSLPNLGGSPRFYVIHWSTDYSVLESSYFSEFAVCDIASGTWNISRITHSQPLAPQVGWQFNVGGYGAGVTNFSGGLALISYLRISERFHPTAEANQDWVSESAAPTVTGYQPPLELVPVASGQFVDYDASDIVSRKLTTSGDGGGDPSYAGPAELVAAISAEANARRLWSPLLNVEINGAPTLRDTYLPQNFYAIGDDGLRYGIQHFWVRPVPPGALFGKVRVHVQTWISAGAPGGTAVSFKVKLLSLASRPKNAAALVTNGGSIIAESTSNHGISGVGTWLDLGELLLKTKDGFTFFALGFAFGTGTGHDFVRAKIKQVTVDAYSKEW